MKRILLILTVLLMTTKSMAQTDAGNAAAVNDFDFTEMEYGKEQTTFRLFAPPTAKSVKVRLYSKGTGGKPLATAKMTLGSDGIWTATVRGDQQGRFYTFDAGRGETPGVFAKAVGVNGRRAAIVDMPATDPQGWHNDRRPVCKSPADLIIYELHHRDFSIARADAVNKGKFLALSEPWAIEHLKRLGVNAVHLLPSYDYGSVDETRLGENQYNWGYDPVNYNVPEGSYSTDPYAPEVRIREFKQMVQALHRAGIRVILDVVYNHTYDIDHSNFQLTYPDYYYRTVAADGEGAEGGAQQPAVTYSNGSGCGNETASERPLMRRFMMESVRYWIEEYHVDGLRFDLMGCHDVETMNAIRQMVDSIDPSIFIYGEGWSAGSCALPAERLAAKANVVRMPRIAAFSDELRDALRGPFSDDSKGGWLAGDYSQQESLKFGIAGGVSHQQIDFSRVNYTKESWLTDPVQMISYVSCHDDMCLTDRLRASVPSLKDANTGLTDEQQAELVRLDLLAQTAVMTSQGVPFMLCGEELLRSKQGVHNSYKSPDSINRLDWQNAERFPLVLDYYSRLTALRSNHPAFRLGDASLVRKHLEFIGTRPGVVAFRLKEYAGRDDWRNIVVVLNATTAAQQVAVPKGSYTVVCRDCRIDERGMGTISGSNVTVAAQTALIMHD